MWQYIILFYRYLMQFLCSEHWLPVSSHQVIRHYHGHLSACYGLALHPTIDVLVTCGRDSTARVWDMRTKANIHTLTGHSNTIASVVCQAAEPQVSEGLCVFGFSINEELCIFNHHYSLMCTFHLIYVVKCPLIYAHFSFFLIHKILILYLQMCFFSCLYFTVLSGFHFILFSSVLDGLPAL